MDLLAMTLAELKQGWHVETDDYCCNCCNYRCRLLSDIQQHVADQHQGADLVHNTTRYNTLTDKQQRLFTLFAAGKRDKEIAEELQLSPSTIRHQKFTFRERAKQAKYYLATFEKTFLRIIVQIDCCQFHRLLRLLMIDSQLLRLSMRRSQKSISSLRLVPCS